MAETFSPENQTRTSTISDELGQKIRKIIKENKAEKSQVPEEARIFGDTFELLASEENHLRHKETTTQKDLRCFIESIYQEAELIIGTTHERPSKPDGVSVSFDNQGKLIIDEVVEFKSSNNAYVHGITKEQPLKTIETISDIIIILNSLNKGKEIADIKPKDLDLSLEKKVTRNIKLNKIKTEIENIIGKNNIITYSPELIYRFIVPKGENIPQFNTKLLIDLGYSVKLEMTHSQYSKKDIHQIIDQQT